MFSGLLYPYQMDESICSFRGAHFTLFSSLYFKEKILLLPKRVDPAQTPLFAASGLVLHCLPMSYLWGMYGLNDTLMFG